jgi:putative ABC transport system substrate-binding protein
LDLLKGIAPNLTRVGVLQNAKSPTWSGQLQAIEAAAPSLGTQIVPAGVESAADIERSTAEIGREVNGGLIVMPDSLTLIHRKLIVSLAERYHLPAIYPFRYFPDDGGLISYGVDLADVWRRAATYVDRIFKGTAAGDLPVQQPTKFELVINLRTAKAFGLEVPPTLLARADEVIE